MIVNVGLLRLMIDGLDDSVEIRMATQPNHPLETAVAGFRLVNPAEDQIQKLREVEHNHHHGFDDDRLTPEQLESISNEISALEQGPEILYVLEGTYLGRTKLDHWSI